MQNLAYQKTIIFAGNTNRHESALGTLRGWQIPNPRLAGGIFAGMNEIPLETAGFFVVSFGVFKKYDYFCA